MANSKYNCNWRLERHKQILDKLKRQYNDFSESNVKSTFKISKSCVQALFGISKSQPYTKAASQTEVPLHCHKSRPIFRDIPRSVDAR